MPVSSTPLPRAGEHVGRYEILTEVAHGGMAAVYAVRLPQEGGVQKLLAMKVLLPHLAHDAHFVAMFMDEARIASQLHHPNVVHTFEVGTANGLPYLVMEYLRGQSLAAFARRAAVMGRSAETRALALHVLSEAARGLHAAHETVGVDGGPLGIVHRDVSPQNIHVGYDGSVKVVDFGIAAARGRTAETRSGEVKGKLEFLAPEQIHRRVALDRRVDVWALGVTAYQLLTGERPLRGDTDADTMFNVLHREIPDVQSLSADMPDDLATFIMRCLERDPDRRPATALEVCHAFARASGALGGASPEDTARVMKDLFEGARAREDERLGAALALERPPTLRDAEQSSGRVHILRDGVRDEPTVVETSPSPRRSRGLVALGVVGLAIALGLGGVALLGVGDARRDEAPAAPSPAGAAPASEARPSSREGDRDLRARDEPGAEARVENVEASDEPAQASSDTLGATEVANGVNEPSGASEATPPPPENRRTKRSRGRRATARRGAAMEPSAVDARGTGLLDVPLP